MIIQRNENSEKLRLNSKTLNFFDQIFIGFKLDFKKFNFFAIKNVCLFSQKKLLVCLAFSLFSRFNYTRICCFVFMIKENF